MNIETPSFWYRNADQEPPLPEKALGPLSLLYRAGYEIHQATGRFEKFGVPVVCIGNINAGGTGKTPVALALMKIIKDNHLARNPVFLSRGYGGGEYGPLLVDLQKHTAWNTGDEALLLARMAPTIIASDRRQGMMMALHNQAGLVVMDDGLQNPHIYKNLKIVVISGEMGFGNGKILPAGPLREPLKRGLNKADAFVMVGPDLRNSAALLPPEKPLFHVERETEGDLPPKDKKYLAFAGIGYPDKFFTFLQDVLGLNLVEKISRPDHYPYTEKDMEELSGKAAAQNADLVTTEKDAMRLPKNSPPVHVVKMQLRWSDERALIAFLKERLAA